MSLRPIVSATLKCMPWSWRTHIRKVPGVAKLQRAIVSSVLEGAAFMHRVDAGPARGITFYVCLPEDKGIWAGTYEPVFASRIASAVRPGSVAYDIGSWHGYFAGVMAAAGAHRVHAFEPLPANADRVRRLIALNPERSIALHPCAVSNRDGEMDLLIMGETSMAKLDESPFQSSAACNSRLRVAVRSIDSMVASGEIAPPALMKIDVEGAELLVLQGARRTLREYKPELFVEVHSTALLEQCSSLLQSEGYSVEPLDEEREAARATDVFQIRAAA